MTDESRNALKNLTTKEQVFGAKFLKVVLQDQRTKIDNINDAKSKIIVKLIDSFDQPELQTFLIQSLSNEAQKQLFKHFTKDTWYYYFQYWPNPNDLPHHFENQPLETQRKILNTLFRSDRERFSYLKPYATPDTHYIQGVRIESKSTTEEMIQAETETLLNQIFQHEADLQKITFFHKKLEEQFEQFELETLYLKLIHEFKKNKIELNSPKSFSCYIKLFRLIDEELLLFPILETALLPVLDQVLVTTSKLQDFDWQLTILSQLPKNVLKNAIKRLKLFDSIREFEKRTLYGKLKETLEKQLHNPKANNILAAWEEV